MTELVLDHNTERQEQPRLARVSGRHFVPATDCSYLPTIEVGDVLEVDFDVGRVMNDGLYLAEVIEHDRCIWRGCRRFARTPGTVRMDSTGGGEWTAAPAGLRIVGRVQRVFGQK
jgi:hypothetical protein